MPASGLLLALAAIPPYFDERPAPPFLLQHSPTAEKHQIETMAGGAAVIDFDGDGRPDLFFANGAEQPSLRKTGARYANRLYRNLGGWKFEDVTDKAGVRGEGYSIAAAVADFDNDGHADLFVAGVNRNFLYRNRGDGTFEDVTAKAGVAGQGLWAVSAGWFDYDNDGLLDLLVVNYVKWDPAKEPYCGEPGQFRTYCHPKFYEGLPNTLYHNNGDGTFTDVSERAGFARHTGKGMGLAFADYDSDGFTDVFIANDTVPNFLFHNERNGTFREVGFASGAAMNDDGRALSAMGVDFRDIDNDGHPDLFFTALINETFPLFRNNGKGLFLDRTYAAKLGPATLQYSGWGAGIYDFDNDGRKDIFAACGDVQDNTEVYSNRQSRQRNLLLLQQANGTFAAQPIGIPALHRGAVFADFDGDGRVDAVVTRLGDEPAMLRGVSGAANHWTEIRLQGSKSNRDGIGARLRLVTSAGELWNHVTTAVGYASSSDRTVHFGLGAATSIRLIEVMWPSGKVTRTLNQPADRVLNIRE